MMFNVAPSDSSSKNRARPLRILSASAIDRLPPLSPPKSWAWSMEQDGYRIGPRTCGGTAVIGEATEDDGDENSSRDNAHQFKRKPRRHNPENRMMK